ncbi:MAG: hypothetical protein DLM68_11065 [Hyphomicrobiales bacterium]|nr:MAG: hypothetical protein DLM68_11065 [Hyphomicrobiales bacterium]
MLLQIEILMPNGPPAASRALRRGMEITGEGLVLGAAYSLRFRKNVGRTWRCLDAMAVKFQS